MHGVAERAARPGARIGLAYARGLHKLMAYKDEYEVARLHLDPAERARREREFGAGAVVPVLLHPPAAAGAGDEAQDQAGRRSAGVCSGCCARPACLRGTPLDVFGYAGVRRVERALIARVPRPGGARARPAHARRPPRPSPRSPRCRT